jgi:hypothetical protein
MFITVTIESTGKKKTPIKFNKNKFNPFGGWRKPLGAKKRGLWQRIKSWRRALKGGKYKLDGQTAMF